MDNFDDIWSSAKNFGQNSLSAEIGAFLITPATYADKDKVQQQEHIDDRANHIEKLAKSDVDGDQDAHTALLQAFHDLKTDPDRLVIMDRLAASTDKWFTQDAKISFNLKDGELTSIDISPSFWDRKSQVKADHVNVGGRTEQQIEGDSKAMLLIQSRREKHTDLTAEQREWLESVENGILKSEANSVHRVLDVKSDGNGGRVKLSPQELVWLTKYLQSDFAGSGLTFEVGKPMALNPNGNPFDEDNSFKCNVLQMKGADVAYSFTMGNDAYNHLDLSGTTAQLAFLSSLAKENLAKQQT